ncbi:uncharacterized protein LOC142521262 [Primulina tabacum]|uniref:uncharacterized protein LOC142521262 n=1 Tax=Primulina tabacum TaxID=48773 RepID=UPI003F5AD050
MRNRKSGRTGWAALKLDMSKAYDRVEWVFLQKLMNRLGFAETWIDKIMRCVRSVKYYFRINQEVVGPIIPTRGLRQGDPLSPYLFVLCAYGLSALFTSYEARGWIRGVRVASSSPSVSHLFFADDSLVFFRASLEEGDRVKECLHAYERASGQLINYDKSALSFSPNTNSSLIESIKMVLTIPVVQRHDIYLGLPTVSLRSKRLQFRYLVDRVVKRTQGWGHKCFSVGGKEVLIKSVLQSIPTYAMSCFRIPKSICDEIEKECANFWWGVENGKRKLHWKTWDFLCKPKMRGGLGFRKMDEFNRALLANQFWRLLRNPESLATKVLKGRYFRHGDIMTAGTGTNPSFIWRSLVWSREILDKGLIWRVGNGHSIRIFEDNWVPGLTSKLCIPNETWQNDAKVESLIINGVWDTSAILHNFNPFIAEKIIQTPLLAQHTGDTRFWRFDTKGHYSARDGYRLQRGLFSPPGNQSEHSMQKWWSFIWSLSIPPKFAILSWAVWKERLKILHGNDGLLNERVITWSNTFLTEFQAAKSTARSPPQGRALTSKWKPPEANDLKMNVDACFNEHLNRYSIGGALRDNQGRLLLAFGKQISKPISVLMGELEAVHAGIKLLYDKHIHDVQVTTDSLLAVQAVTTFKDDISYVGLRASVIKDLVQKPVVSSLTYENRLANNVAHIIALFSSCSHSSFVWKNGEFPLWLVNLITLDLSQ